MATAYKPTEPTDAEFLNWIAGRCEDRANSIAATAAKASKIENASLGRDHAIRELRHIACDARHAAETGDEASLRSVSEWLAETDELSLSQSHARSAWGMS
jgi:hypothetical protein